MTSIGDTPREERLRRGQTPAEAEPEPSTGRDERLAAFSPNDRFSTAVPSHVAIRPDWVSQG
ncbi:MAG TPA: hypothetical protein VM287_13445 [Egibacteraceae bacterium]|nr:hypothetical protein [Egibacteraceae bacterium]